MNSTVPPDEGNMPPDSELVMQAQKGDNSAFDTLVTRHRTRVYSMVLTMLRNEADAWDVSQEAFLRAWRSLGRFRNDSAFSTWLYRISTNCALDWMRRARTRPMPEEPREDGGTAHEPADDVSPAVNAERHELRHRIERALERLSPDHRAVILLKEVEGLKYNEIADAVGCSIGTVMSRLFHARRYLQKYLTDEQT